LDKIFYVYIANNKGYDDNYAMLELPATDYELLDTLEKLQLGESDDIYCEIEEYYDFAFLTPLLYKESTLYDLNALAERLSTLDDRQSVAFEGLVRMETDKKEGPFGIPRLIDLAYSVDCCHVVDEARNDSQLGRFYAENGFMPELDNLPENIFHMLNFEQIGREARLAEGGVFTQRGYVTQSETLMQVYDALDLVPHKPDYIFRLTLERYPLEDEDRRQDRKVRLELPATPEQMDAALEKLELQTWERVEITDFDGAVSDLDLDLYYMGGLEPLNALAQKLHQLEAEDKLALYKAILHAADCHDVAEAGRFADDVDAFVIDEDLRTVEEIAVDELDFTMGKSACLLLKKHVDLHAYGTDLLVASHAVLTPYGLVQRRDGEPIADRNNAPVQGPMEMG
jgi:hypothetical protein